MERAKPARLAERWGGLELPTSIPGAQTQGRWGRLLVWDTDSQGSRENHQKFVKNKAEEKCWYGQALRPGADDPRAQSRTPTPPLGQHLHKTVSGFHLPTAFCSC